MNDLSAILARRFPAPAGNFPACFAFSIHKAGSTMMHKMIGEACVEAGIPALTIPDALFVEGLFEKDWGNDRALLPWIRDGVFYYGFRHLPEVLTLPEVGLRTRRCVLLVRDPRDALVSQYFSFGGRHMSHRMPDKNAAAFAARVERTSHLDIDEYVIATARNYLGKLRAYREHLDFDRVLLRRYEDAYYDKRRFLGEIFAHLDLQVPATVLDRVAAANDVRPQSEDPARHIRKGAPGDHREKLRPQTIAQLNALFRDTARDYGYDLAD